MNSHRPRTQDDAGSMHFTLLGVLLLMLALCFAPTANADNNGPRIPIPTPNPQPNPNPGPAPNPGLNQGGNNNNANAVAAPEWVVPGARITETMTMSVAKKEVRPNQPAGLMGRGFTQYDIVAVSGQGVVVQMRSYMAYQQHQTPELNGTQTLALDVATGGGLWMQPTTIAATENSNADPNALVTRESMQINGETYDTIIFVNKSGNTTIRRIYDTRTGIRLAMSNLTEDAQNRNHEAAEYAGYRVAQLPWIGTEFTDQFQQLNKLTYRGTMIFETPQHPGMERMPDVEADIDTEYTFAVAEPGLIAANVAMEMDMPEGPNQTSEGRQPICPGQRMGPFIHPDVLGQLEDGQLLDEDPIIGYRIVVTDVYQANGVTMIEITEQGRGNSYISSAIYDTRSGLQVAALWTQPMMNQRLEVRLDAVE